MTNIITRSFDSLGRSSGFDFSAGYDLDYGFDALGLFFTVQSVINGATNDFVYNRLVNSGLIATMVSDSMTNSRSYELDRNLVTAVKNMFGTTTISKYEYSNDALGRRTQRIDTTTSVTTNDFGYNTRNELTNAVMGAESFGFDFDNLGNREAYTTNSTTFTYSVNNLNQYTQITNGGLKTLTYDSDGNTLTYNGWTYAWNNENRMESATSTAAVVLFQYDYMGRRFQKVVAGVTNSFVYDGWNLVQETSGTNVTRYVWGLDLSGSMQGAGGIGGLLSVIENGVKYFPCFDANGNITEYVAANGTVVASYEYGPFGQIIASTGTKKDDFKFRFSTKYYDVETGFYYYGYRYYNPELGRWPSRDPIEERGGLNVYAFVGNRPLLLRDVLGLTVRLAFFNGKVSNFSYATVWGRGDYRTVHFEYVSPAGTIAWNEYPWAFWDFWIMKMDPLYTGYTDSGLEFFLLLPGQTTPNQHIKFGGSSRMVDADYVDGANESIYKNRCCSELATLPIRLGANWAVFYNCSATSGDPSGIWYDIL